MGNGIILQGALANAGGGQTLQNEFLNFMKVNTPNTDFYKLTPRPGTIMHAALDWQAILGTTMNLIELAGLLWTAYERFIKPRKEKNSFIFVQIKNEKKNVQFTVGKESQEKEVFIKEFSEKVQSILVSSNIDIKAIKKELEDDNLWKKV